MKKSGQFGDEDDITGVKFINQDEVFHQTPFAKRKTCMNLPLMNIQWYLS